MNKYIVHTTIKCSDGKIHRLSYDMASQTEGSVYEISRILEAIEERFPDTHFCVQRYTENSFETIYGDINSMKVD